MTDADKIVAKLLKRNAKSRGKTPISMESLHSMARATHGRFDNVEITTKRGRPVMICRGLVTWHKHDRLIRQASDNGKNAERTA